MVKWTNLGIKTYKEDPSDAEVPSHKLLVRSGLIKKLSSGIYTYSPLFLRALRKLEGIVREELDSVGMAELLMPMVQPKQLWVESKRWGYPDMQTFTNKNNNEFCLGPTHEEVITDLIRNEISSYKQLPANFYQIQTKFRDEIRPRFGVMRSREFIMKDAYSFHASHESLEGTYDVMHQTYCNIFNRIGLDYRPVLADTGSIGGSGSHEFHVLASSGEDDIAFSNGSDYAANVELAEAITTQERSAPSQSIEKVATPEQHSIEEVSQFLSVSPSQVIKTLIVLGEEQEDGSTPLLALVLRGDHELNDIKAEKLAGVASPLTLASEEQVEAKLNCKVGSLGPKDLPIKTYIDRSAAALSDFICGANEDGYHLTGANWERDIIIDEVVDIRNVVIGDPSPCGKGTLDIKRGIEVGHIFQLGTKYSEAMNATILDENGKSQTMVMGCYGIGVTRVVAAAIEQNHDDNGIIWPEGIAPFQVALIPINVHKSEAVSQQCEQLYSELQAAGIDVLYMDEAKARLGVMLADTELMGIPHRLVVGDRGLEKGSIEYKGRRDTEKQDIVVNEVIEFIKSQC